jgi:2-polyprenyl-3-methyl-5-hydroxy-6-metoxy-1,4-benzoquinol methylase
MYDKKYYSQFEWIVPTNFNSVVLTKTLGANIVDVGCGNGTLGEEIAKYAHSYLGVDISEYAYEEMRDKNLDCVITTEESLFDFRNTFDLACMFDVLEHLTNIQIVNLLDRLPNSLIFSSPLEETPDETHINVKTLQQWNKFFEGLGYIIEKIGEFIYPEPDGSHSVTTVFYANKQTS